jgi:hypothetical protein
MMHTEDFQFVCPTDSVFEIQYRRLNAETSIAEPTLIMAETAPGKIWKNWKGCKKECDRLNGLPYVPESNTIKIVKETLCQ